MNAPCAGAIRQSRIEREGARSSSWAVPWSMRSPAIPDDDDESPFQAEFGPIWDRILRDHPDATEQEQLELFKATVIAEVRRRSKRSTQRPPARPAREKPATPAKRMGELG